MGGEDNVPAASEAEDSAKEELIPANFSISIHSLIDEAQSSHGLVQNDYGQYHAYCTRRLDRLRHAKEVRRDLSHHSGNQNKGKGKNQKGSGRHAFLPKSFSVEDYNRHINFSLVTLFSAERAWAHGLSIKSQHTTEGKKSNIKQKSASSVRKHYLNRLKKAAKWALELDDVMNSVGDERTQLEAKCYRGWMKGSCALEMGNWKDACSELHTALTICRALAMGIYGSKKKSIKALELQDFFNARAENVIQPLLRYCQYELQAVGSMSEEQINVFLKDVENKALENHTANENFKKNLQRLQQKGDTQSKTNTGTMGQITFREKEIPVENKDLRMILMKIVDKKADIEKILEQNENTKNKTKADAKFMTLLSEYDDAVTIISSDLKQYMGMKSGPAVNAKRFHCECLMGYVKYEKLTLLMKRNEKMVDEMREKEKDATSSITDNSVEKSDQVQDVGAVYKMSEQIAHLYDALLQDARVVVNLPGGGDGTLEEEGGDELVEDEFMLEASAHVLRIRALRCYYLGKMYSASVVRKYFEAIALFKQASSLAEQAAEEIAACSGMENSDAIIETMAHLERDIEAALCLAEANAYLIKNGAMDTTVVGSGTSLINRLDEFDSGGKACQLADIPPTFERIVCKPTFFDIANNYVNEISTDELQTHIESNKAESKSLLGWLLGS